MNVDEAVREYVDAHVVPVDLDEVTTIPLSALAAPRRRARAALAVAAGGIAASVALGAATVAVVRRGESPAPPSQVGTPTAPSATAIAPSPTTAASQPAATSPTDHDASPAGEVGALITPDELADIALATLGEGMANDGAPWTVREAQRRVRNGDATYSWVHLQGPNGRVFVEAYDAPLDIAASPPYPGDVIPIHSSTTTDVRWVWPIEPFVNTAAVTTERITVLVRAESFDTDATVGVFGWPTEYPASNMGHILSATTTGIAYRMNELFGLTSAPPPADEPPFTIVPLAELDQPGEAARSDEYEQLIASGPFVGADGRTYGRKEWTEPDPETGTTELVSSPDFEAYGRNVDGEFVIIGFASTSGGFPFSGSKITLLYGVTGDVVAFYRQVDLTDANGVYLWSDSEFHQLSPDGTLLVHDVPELVAHDRNGDGVLSRVELHATTDALRRVIRGDGVQGSVYASDLLPFLESMAGVEDPTTGAVSVVVPFFDMELTPAGEIDLGAADTVLFDEAGQPIGGWGTG